MKKVIALLLSLVMVLGCGVVAVSADSGTQDYTRKMDAALIEKLNDPDVDQVDVCIFLKNAIHSDAQVEQIISERYTWTTQQEHLMCWRKVVSEIIGAYVQQFLDDNGDLLDEVLWHCDAVEMIEASVSKENVYRLAELDIVSSLDLYIESYPEPEIDPEPAIAEMIADAANERYFDPRHPITAESIIVFDFYAFMDESAYAVFFYVKGMEYTCDMIEERIGDWLLVTSRPEPFLFVNDKLYGLKEAYDAGIMTDVMLAELAGSSFRGGSRYPILVEYIKGDADGDGECNVIDATCIQRYDATIIGDHDLYKPLADVDGDSDVSVIDATLIQRYDVGLLEIE